VLEAHVQNANAEGTVQVFMELPYVAVVSREEIFVWYQIVHSIINEFFLYLQLQTEEEGAERLGLHLGT
jgi:hypothetical protein